MNPLIAITAVWSLTTWALWAKFLVDYFTGNESVFANVCTGTQSQTHVDSPLLVAYIIGNTIVLLFGPMQAFKMPRLHRIIGIIYINGCIFVSLSRIAIVCYYQCDQNMIAMSTIYGVIVFVLVVFGVIVLAFAVQENNYIHHVETSQRLFWLATAPEITQLMYFIPRSYFRDYMMTWAAFIIPMAFAEVTIYLRALDRIPNYIDLYN